MFRCFRCGDETHLSYECPTKTRGHASPAPSPASGQTAADRIKLPGYGVGVPPRRPDSEIADAAVWAASIREFFGWDETSASCGQVNRATRQAEESRKERYSDVPPY